MINAENIGKHIKMLRKRKKVSQETMALDLGMYQADISNLERAMGGSGITDLLKLDLIADYFGITLGELLNGPDSEAPKPEVGDKEDHTVNDYVIAGAAFADSDLSCASELVLKAPNGKIQYVTFDEYDDRPAFYRSNESIFAGLAEKIGDASFRKNIRPYCFLSGEDYIDIFNAVEPQWLGICRYLIFIATEDENEAADLIRKTKGKVFTQIKVPVPSAEPEDLFYADYSDLAAVYRYRLMVEACLKNPSVFSDADDTVRREKAILKKLKAACASEEAYKVWKKDLIDAKIADVMKTQKIVTCTYVFAGVGQYKEMMPEETVESFKNWVNANGSGFFCGVEPATKREIRTYVSQHIADDLFE